MYRTYRKEAEALVQQMTVAEQASQLRSRKLMSR